MLGIGLVGRRWKHDLIDLDVYFIMVWEMDWWIDDDLEYVFSDVFGHFGPFEVSFFFVWLWMLLSQDGQTFVLFSRSTTKNMENNAEMLEGSQGDLFDDAGQGLDEFRIPSPSLPIYIYVCTLSLSLSRSICIYIYKYVICIPICIYTSAYVSFFSCVFRLQLDIVWIFQHFSQVTWSFCPFPWIFPDAWHWTPAWQVLLRILAHVSCT